MVIFHSYVSLPEGICFLRNHFPSHRPSGISTVARQAPSAPPSALFFLPSSARRSHLETMVGPAEKQWLGLSYHKPTAVYLGGGWATYHYHWLVILSINLWFILMVIILLIMVNIYIYTVYIHVYIYIWVVVDLPLWNIDEFVSWDYYPQYIIWKNDKCSKPTRYGLYNYRTLMTMGNAGSLINLDAYIKDDYGLSTINQRYIVTNHIVGLWG